MPSPYSLLEKWQDLAVSFKGILFLLISDLIALLAFVIMPQGTDVMLAIGEDIGSAHPQPGTTISLILALWFWSVSAEYCSRLLVYMTDSSGHVLPDFRVKIRERNQEIIATAALFFPQFLTIAAFIKVLIANGSDIRHVPDLARGIWIIIAFQVVSAVLLYLLYKKGWITSIATKYRAFSWLKLSKHESIWVGKLYGIFNDVRVSIPSSLAGNYPGGDLPRLERLPNGMKLPDSAYFMPYPGNPQREDQLCTWMFTIRWQFYKNLLRQLLVLAIIAIAIICFFTFNNNARLPIKIGSIAILCLAFACWQVIYTCLHFADKAQSHVPVRFLLFILLIVCSIVNNDHPARTLPVAPRGHRMELNAHFANWVHELQTDTDSVYYRVHGDTIPVVFVASEGGALRTGAFTAMMLSALSDRFHNFPKYIYCYSSVSGGTVGANIYNAALIQKKLNRDTSRDMLSFSTQFFKNDFLAAVTGKMLFAEIIGYFLPVHNNRLDRAVALEKGWEVAWDNYYHNNLLGESFDTTIGGHQPMVLINTTEVETGLQCLWSNVDVQSLPNGTDRDLYTRMDKNLPYSTAINLSSRFPLVSPGAAFFCRGYRRHYVDGGYYENKGAETLLQVLQQLHTLHLPVKPFVLQFNFGQNDTTYEKGVKSFNELNEIFAGIYGTRSGRGTMAQTYLKKFLDTTGGVMINLYMREDTKKFPMNWVLSTTSVDRLQRSILDVVTAPTDTTDQSALRQLFLYNSDDIRRR